MHDNTFSDNGKAPNNLIAAAVDSDPVADIIGTAALTRRQWMMAKFVNCLMVNGAASYENFNFCGDFPAKS